MDFITLIVLAILGEAVWETLKMTWQEGKVSIDKIGALAISTIIVFGTGIDIISMVGIEMKWKSIGLILTAVLISRGATFIHELISRVSTIKSNNKYDKETIITTEGIVVQNGSVKQTIKEDSIINSVNGTISELTKDGFYVNK